MTNYVILLPPSEGKVKGGDYSKPYRVVENFKKYNSFINLKNSRELVYDKVKEIISISNDAKELEKVFELKGKKLQEVIEVMSDLLNEETLPAIERYSGVMFNSINYENLSVNQKENFDFSVIFVDGLFGLLRPQDLIPEYKLKITSKILDLNVTKFWKDKLEKVFHDLFKEKLVIDILPEAHRKVLPDTFENIISIKFCEVKNNKLKNVGHDSKILKGDLIQYLVSRNNLTREDLEKFEHEKGYKYSREYSNENEIVYLKNDS